MTDGKGLIYLDHAATTATDPDVVRAMEAYQMELYGNPATLYELGQKSDKAVEEARRKVADVIGCKAEEVYFTCGGTESDNWAVKGVAFSHQKKGKHIITSQVEHHAVMDTCKFMERIGWEVTYVPVDGTGTVNPDDVKKAIRPETVLISVMHANNEVGTIEPVEAIGRIAREHDIPFHTDTVQSVGRIPVRVEELGCDLLSLSAHKFYGPKGVGAMFLKRGVRIERHMHGGAQERSRRAGTHNVPGIVGLGRAIELAAGRMQMEVPRLTALAQRLKKGLLASIPDVRLDGHPTNRLPGNVHICVEGVEGEAMLLCLDGEGVACSSGSACTTGSLDPSHVLLAMGLPAEVAHGSVRFTMGTDNTEEQIDRVIEAFPPIVERLRAMSPTYRKK